jgi:outer membrane receptor protein involved in Fe transport
MEHLKLYMRVDNLFDRRYEVADGFRGPGITGLAGIAAEF